MKWVERGLLVYAFLLPLLASFTALLVGSLSMDLLHLRFFWVPVGLVLGSYYHRTSVSRAL